jgi:proteasome assembly chaperone 3
MAEKEDYTVSTTPYPARIKHSSALINNIPTTATSIYFADKIMVTVTQNGRLAHWVCFLPF